MSISEFRLDVSRSSYTNADCLLVDGRRGTAIDQTDMAEHTPINIDEDPRNADWLKYVRFDKFVAQAPWTFAKTYADFAPHEYTLLNRNEPWEFAWAAGQIFLRGVRQAFYSYNHQYFIRRGWRYWSMDPTPESTNLINRARDFSEAYDAVAAEYAAFFVKPESEPLFRTLATVIEPAAQEGLVLDLGCGTGWMLDRCKVGGEYHGVDPSAGMLTQLSKKHPSAKVIHGSVFEPWQRSMRPQLITALRGTLSYMSIAEVQAMSALMSPDTKIFLMAYGQGNADPLLTAKGIECVTGDRAFTDQQAAKLREKCPVEVFDWHGYTVVTNFASAGEFSLQG